MIYILNKKNISNLYKFIFSFIKNKKKIIYKKNIINNFFLIIHKNKNKIKDKFLYKHSKYPGGLKKYSNIKLYKKNFLSFIKIYLKKWIKKKYLNKIKSKNYNKIKILNINV